MEVCMRQLLLRVAIYLLLASPAIPNRAAAQYLFMDTNGDGRCDFEDLIHSPVDTIDVWLDTSQDGHGSPAVCPTGGEMSISGYELVLRADTYPTGSVAFGVWTNLIPQFTSDLGTIQEGNLLRVGHASLGSTTDLPAGKYLRSEEHTSELQSHHDLVCRLLLEKKKK